MDPMCSLYPCCFLSNGDWQLAAAHVVSATVMIGVKSSDSIRKDKCNKKEETAGPTSHLDFDERTGSCVVWKLTHA